MLSPQPKAAGRQQGNAGDILEMGLVAMPADTGARPVFIDQHLREGLGRPVRKGRDLLTQRQQEVGDRQRLDDFATVIVIAQTETDDPTVCEMAVEIERLERQSFEMPGKLRLFPRRDQSGLVGKTFGQILRSTKEIMLEHRSAAGGFRFERRHPA